MIRFAISKGIVFLLLLLMVVRVSVTPGVRHRHEQGHLTHSHHHGHSHAHSHGSHSHAEDHTSALDEDAAEATSHIHVSIFGWEFTLSSPGDADDPEGVAGDAAPLASKPTATLPDSAWIDRPLTSGSLIHWLFDLRSTAPPPRLKLPDCASLPHLAIAETVFRSQDRAKPAVPPPERIACCNNLPG